MKLSERARDIILAPCNTRWFVFLVILYAGISLSLYMSAIALGSMSYYYHDIINSFVNNTSSTIYDILNYIYFATGVVILLSPIITEENAKWWVKTYNQIKFLNIREMVSEPCDKIWSYIFSIYGISTLVVIYSEWEALRYIYRNTIESLEAERHIIIISSQPQPWTILIPAGFVIVIAFSAILVIIGVHGIYQNKNSSVR